MERRVIVEMNNQPLVSVPVITYNSSKFVLETLESIKAQTYQNIELIISDDCSTDNTVELCRKWIDENKARFVHTQIITSEMNAGISANLNRADAACQGEWVKGIAGDDLLLPNCIADCVEYIQQYPNIIYLFGRIESFGASDERCQEINKFFDYSFFSMTTEEQLHKLIFVGNCVPATTAFYNRENVIKIGISNDERIPLLEDWPKWINLLRAGVKLHFVNKLLVRYRINGISTRKRCSLASYRSERLFYYYYIYPAWIEEGYEHAIKKMVDRDCVIYKQLIEAENEEQFLIHKQRDEYKDMYENCKKQLKQISSSKAYRLGKALLKPFSIIKKIKG